MLKAQNCEIVSSCNSRQIKNIVSFNAKSLCHNYSGHGQKLTQSRCWNIFKEALFHVVSFGHANLVLGLIVYWSERWRSLGFSVTIFTQVRMVRGRTRWLNILCCHRMNPSLSTNTCWTSDRKHSYSSWLVQLFSQNVQTIHEHRDKVPGLWKCSK